jgi:hypothetical protein
MFYKTPVFINKGFTLCYDGQDTNVNLINTNGYYTETVISRTHPNDLYTGFSKERIDTNRRGFILFKDGTCAYHFMWYTTHKDPVPYFKEIVYNDSLYTGNFYKYIYWGMYHIINDTVIAQCTRRPILFSNGDSWDGYEYRYKIIDRNTIQCISEEIICRKRDKKYNNMYLGERTFYPAKFIPTEVVPTSNGWIKKKKWFWCNKEDWKAYKEKMKKNEKYNNKYLL